MYTFSEHLIFYKKTLEEKNLGQLLIKELLYFKLPFPLETLPSWLLKNYTTIVLLPLVPDLYLLVKCGFALSFSFQISYFPSHSVSGSCHLILSTVCQNS